VIAGKLVLHEYATGFPDPGTGFPIARNPWDLTHVPAGSSSGTGVAVAAGLVLGGLGTDTSGSIRGPAAFCGISGHKPTFGRVSKEGCVPLGYSLDNIGPMARTARDCALMLQVLAGHDPADPCSADRPVPDYAASLTGSLKGVRVGVPRDYFFTVPELDAEVKAAVLAAVERMAEAGATVVDVAIPHAADGHTATTVTIRAESYGYHERDLRERPHLYGRYTRQVLQIGALFSAADFVQAQRARALLQAECAAALAQVDVLVVPTMLTAATPFSGFNPDGRVTAPSFTGIWNLVGLPALSVPCGFTEGGLPIGMQIVGRPFEDARVLAVGDAYQQVTDWHTRVPIVPSSVPPVEPPAPFGTPEPVAAVETIAANARMTLVDDDRARLDANYPKLRAQADEMREAVRMAAEPALAFRAEAVQNIGE
jgi:aspartyl-tRNA(Asn)/glutamyl-tRNA(Gln) amidotransferase subunit A